MEEKNIKRILEAVLFAMGGSVELDALADACGESVKHTKKLIEELAAEYDEEERGMQIIALEDSYQMCTRSIFYENLIKVAAHPKKFVLTDVVLETLSIIAYKQPVTRLEIEQIRGVKSDHAVNKLVELGLVEEIGRLNAPGRPILFGTTEEFLRRFGVTSTETLPQVRADQLEEFKEEAESEIPLGPDSVNG